MQRGFTLIELLVAVAIVAILVATAIPQYKIFRIRAERTASLSLLGIIGKGQTAHYAAAGEYAPTYASLGNPAGQMAALTPALIDPMFQQLEIPSSAQLLSSKAYRFRNIQYVALFGSPSPCVEAGLKPQATCGYTIRVCSDKDNSGGAVGSCWGQDDVYVIMGNNHKVWYLTDYSGPINVPFMKYDDLRKQFLF